MNPKINILLINLGSPEDCSVPSVRKYLKEFLSDRRVIDLPRWQWLPILHGIILPIRAKKTAKLYHSIWNSGSPLINISKRQQQQLQERFKDSKINIELAMSYGKPSMSKALQQISKDQHAKLLILPLYPQYSSTTVASVFDQVAKHLKSIQTIPECRIINGYHREPAYIDCLTDSIQKHWQTNPKPEKLIFSYHGVPVRYIDQGDRYYQDCIETTQAVVQKLGLSPDDYITTFQSRFGREEWIKPYTDQTIIELARNGVKSIHILSPAFAADCLETLEELEVQNSEYFRENGGEVYQYIPALNDSSKHIDLLEQLIKKHTHGWLYSSD